MAKISTITATIYWDDQAVGNEGWAYATVADGEHDTTGPLKTLVMDDLPNDADDAALVEALRDTLTDVASATLSDNDITIDR